MALPVNVQTQAELEQAMGHYATASPHLDHFAFGKFQVLTEGLKNVKIGDYLLFVPYSSIKPRDSKGSFDGRFVSNIIICTPVKKDDFAAEKAAISQAMAVMMKLLVRLRNDQNEYGWSFTINDISDIDPVVDHLLTNVAGCQCSIYFGDFNPVVIDPADWTDL